MKHFTPRKKGLFMVCSENNQFFRLFFVVSIVKKGTTTFVKGWFFSNKSPPFDTALTVLESPNKEYFFRKPLPATTKFFKRKMKAFLTPTVSDKTKEHIKGIISAIS